MCIGVVGLVEKIDGKEAIVNFGGARRSVRVDLVRGRKVGDKVVVHAGFAIEKVREAHGR